MNPLLSAITAVFALFALTPLAGAGTCPTDRYMHNGSVMEVHFCNGGSVTISYVQPRAGMIKAGARNGSLLFDGFEQPNGVITGNSRLFSARCGVVPYAVSGSRQGNAIVLNGTAPIRGKGCQVVRYRQDNLVFSLLGAGPQVVPAQCPPGFTLSGGQCIRMGAAPAPIPVPVPQPQPGGNAGDWYAIAGSFRKRGPAQARVNQLGPGWFVMNTSQCPNFRNGYWIATAGGFAKGTAQLYVNQARKGAYKKTCN